MKITFKLIDGKPVPHVWTMPEAPRFPINGQTNYEIYEYNITYARENCIPVKEEFREKVKEKIFNSIPEYLAVKFLNTKDSWQPDIFDYDVDMEFEIEIEDCLIKVQTGFHCGLTDKCNQGCEKVAILKTEEMKQLSDYRTVTDKVQVEPVKEQKEQVKLSNKIDDVLQSYLPDDYYKEIRKKLIPKIVKLFKNLNQPTESGEDEALSSKLS